MVRLSQGSFAIEGPARSGKSWLLVDRAVELLQSEPTESVLVLCSNYYRKSRFLEHLQEKLTGGYSQLPVTTYSALVRNTLSLYWPEVEELITQKAKLGGKPVIFPELSGFEASEYMIKKVIAQLKLRHPGAFQEFQGSERSLITQLVRRIRLRAENCLERREMRHRSQMIGEGCLQEIDEVIKWFDLWSSKLRVLDNSKQIDVFLRLLRENSNVQSYFRDRVRHLLVDDLDETIPAQQQFVKFLAPSTETLILAADIQGGTRRGYLNAYPYDWEGLKSLKSSIQTLSLSREDRLYSIAGQLLKNWTAPNAPEGIETLPVESEIQWRAAAISRMDMLSQAIDDIIHILQRQVISPEEPTLSPSDLVIVMPRVDPLARLQIQQQLGRRGIPLQVLTGTERPTDNPVCRSLLLMLQMANRDAWKMPLSPLEFKGILRHALKLHELDASGLEDLVEQYRLGLGRELLFNLPSGDPLTPLASARYKNLINWLENHVNEPLEEQIYSAFQDVISPQLTAEDDLADMHQMIRSLYIRDVARSFQGESNQTSESRLADREWFIQVKTGIVSDTPNKPREIDPNAIVLGTPQKIIDFEIERPIHFWLDISSREWSRTDSAPLYNAWIHSVNWDGSTSQASDSFNQLLARTRAGHITRTLLLYARERVFLYSSELDDQGRPNTGIFQKLLLLPRKEVWHRIERAALREDQASILSYPGGAMAITAVPGAGKTFINLELLLELIERGVAPESILVLTYMDSAARTLQSRLKNKLSSGQYSLPVISTIHSLALRIITEDDHAVYLGLDPEHLQIADEIQERELLQAVISQYDAEQGYFQRTDSALGCIQFAKSHRIDPQDLKRLCAEKGLIKGRLFVFVLIYEAYQRLLQQKGLLDFTDLILKAMELLEKRQEIREKYNHRFHYIIEDEAQDSSLLLQSFIQLLQGEQGNLIRTGDTNQSITTTFSTAETAVFRDFIKECRQSGLVVEMNQSGRCAEPVIDLANAFIHWASQDEVLRNAFHPVAMKPVSGSNPSLLEPITCKVFDTHGLEQGWLSSRIRELQAQYPEQSVTVLVRFNQEALNITQMLQSQGIQAISHSNSPDSNPVFLLIVLVLKILENPADRPALKTLYQHMVSAGLLSLSAEEQELYSAQNLFSLDPKELKNGSLLQLYYNIQDLARYAFGQDICRLVVRLTDTFFTDPQQRSIGYLCALKAQEWVDHLARSENLEHSPLEWVNREFASCLDKKRLPFRSIQEIMTLSSPLKSRFVQVMTLHKAKGQEFDFVFIPGITEGAFPSTPQKTIWGEEDKLRMELEQLRSGEALDKNLLAEQEKLKKVEEEARLIYVGLTRARQGLFLSCPKQIRERSGRLRPAEPSRYFIALQSLLENSHAERPAAENMTHA